MSGAYCAVAAAVCGVASAGVSIYSASQSGPDMATTTPASYYTYDADGNLTGSQVWDASQNAYIYTTNLTAEQKAERKKIAALKTQLLNNLSETPSDRVLAYDEYAKAFSESMHKDADEQFNKLSTATEESMAAKGMLGSKAYVDSMADLRKEKEGMDTDIAQKATLAKETLATNDKNYWLNALTALDNSENADSALALQQQQQSANAAAQATSTLAANTAIGNSSRYANWQNKISNLNSAARALGNTSSGLAFLYGYKGNGRNSSNFNNDDYLQTHASFYGY